MSTASLEIKNNFRAQGGGDGGAEATASHQDLEAEPHTGPGPETELHGTSGEYREHRESRTER